jgi:hypothetical protein
MSTRGSSLGDSQRHAYPEIVVATVLLETQNSLTHPKVNALYSRAIT